LREEIRKLFGFDIGESTRSPRPEQCFANVASYIAGHCQPFCDIADGERALSKVGLWLPVLNEEPEALQKAICNSQVARDFGLGTEEGAKRRLVVNVETPSDPFYNPFTIVAMSYCEFPQWNARPGESDNFGGVISVDYWKGNIKLKAMLEGAEIQETAKNLAVGGVPRLTKNGGIGYLEPRFVTDSKWRRLRWRPWAQGEEELEAVDAKALVFAYACLGNFHPEPDAGEATAKKVLGLLEAGANWRLPLLQRDGVKWAWKRKLYVQNPADGQSHEEGTQGKDFLWKVNEKLPTLSKLVQFFEALQPKEVAALKWEWQRSRQLLSSLEVNTSQARALQEANRRFLLWLIETDALANYTDNADHWSAFLDAAAKACLEFLVPRSK
jgi:hypothetical protein